LRKFVAADVAAQAAKGNRKRAIFPLFTTDDYGVHTMSASDPDN
jgi:hypothetical protein